MFFLLGRGIYRRTILNYGTSFLLKCLSGHRIMTRFSFRTFLKLPFAINSQDAYYMDQAMFFLNISSNYFYILIFNICFIWKHTKNCVVGHGQSLDFKIDIKIFLVKVFEFLYNYSKEMKQSERNIFNLINFPFAFDLNIIAHYRRPDIWSLWLKLDFWYNYF